MADITGTNSADFLFFSGTLGQVSTTFVNAYSGHTITIDEEKNVNQSTYEGLAGIDTLFMSSYGDILDLDAPEFNAPAVSNIERFVAGNGSDIIALDSATIVLGDVVIDGGNADDVLWGNAGNDTLEGRGGDDQLEGGPGNDTYLYTTFSASVPNGHDVIYDVSGNDTISVTQIGAFPDVSFSRSGMDLIIDFKGDGQHVVTVQDHFVAGGAYAVETLTFVGRADVDLTSLVLNTDPVAMDDSFNGLEDEILTGNVLADNGSGADSDADGDALMVTAQTMVTAAGATVVLLESGDFTYTPLADYFGTDSFTYDITDGFGGSASATVTLILADVPDAPAEMYGTAGDDVLTGTDSDDAIYGGEGSDHLVGGDGNDILYGEQGADYLQGGAGDDVLHYNADSAWSASFVAWNVGQPDAFGTDQRVSLLGYNRSYDTFDGGDGYDTLVLGSGNDAVFVDDAYSARYAGTSGTRILDVERIDGGDGDDIIDLTSMRYDQGDVTLIGGAGNDVLWASSGNDLLYGGDGLDNLYGGIGENTFLYQDMTEAGDTIYEFETGPAGDILNLTDLLEGFDPGLDDVNNFMRLVNSGSDTMLQVDADGQGGDFVTLATFVNGIDGVSVNDLYADGNLVVDQSVIL